MVIDQGYSSDPLNTFHPQLTTTLSGDIIEATKIRHNNIHNN